MASSRFQTNVLNFKNLCKTLDELNLKYDKDEEKFTVNCAVKVKDMPFDFIIKLNTEIDVLVLLSPVISDVAADRRGSMALAVARANLHMISSNFDFNTKNGSLIFRLSTAYADTVLNREAFKNMVMTALSTIGFYYEKLLAVANNDMSAEQIGALFS